LQIVSLALIAAGIAWAVWIGNRPAAPTPSPSPQPGPSPLDNSTPSDGYTRVEVFATLDRLREWFAEQGNTAGADAMMQGSQSLIAAKPPAPSPAESEA
jgi:hypothetical protein